MLQDKLAQLFRSPHASFVNWLHPTELAADGSMWSALRGLLRDSGSDSTRTPRVALLVTDLVGFTNLTESLGDRAAHELIQAHNVLLRACLRGHDGREFAHTGDGIMACFERADSALGCAVAIQRSLGRFTQAHPRTPLHARIGVHVGHPLPEEGRLFGACVNTSVRVCNAAGADAILVSSLARELGSERFQYEDQGWFRLKGLSDPHRLHALCWREL